MFWYGLLPLQNNNFLWPEILGEGRALVYGVRKWIMTRHKKSFSGRKWEREKAIVTLKKEKESSLKVRGEQIWSGQGQGSYKWEQSLLLSLNDAQKTDISLTSKWVITSQSSSSIYYEAAVFYVRSLTKGKRAQRAVKVYRQWTMTSFAKKQVCRGNDVNRGSWVTFSDR